MDWQFIMFWLFAFITLGATFLVVFLKNIVHSALALILSFLGVAVIYLTMQADFLAAVQVLIYAGAISILIVFGIMIITRNDGRMDRTNLLGEYKISALVVVFILFNVLAYFIIKTPWPVKTGLPSTYTVGNIAELFLSNHVLAFELAALLLTVAMVGAILIAKEVKNNE